MSEEKESESEIEEITYAPLGGQEFGADEMFAQGAAALDLAAIFALDRKDFDGLIRVAREWTRMASVVSGIEALPPESKREPLKFGFHKESAEEEENAENERKSDGEDDVQSRGRLYSYRISSRRSR
jgi:hypothetical protein